MVDYINPPLNYTGNKLQILSQILPLFDYNKNFFGDVFTGGGSVAYNVYNHYDQVYMNDINKDLIELHKLFIIDMPNTERKLVNKIESSFKEFKPTKEEYLKIRTIFNETKEPQERAILFWLLALTCNSNMVRFNKSGKFNQTYGDRTYNTSTKDKINKFQLNSKNFQLRSKPIEHINFNSVSTMYYCDPPYYNTEAGYNAFWSKELEFKLLDKCLNSPTSIAVSGVLFDYKENSPLLLGLQENKWKTHLINKHYDGARKNKFGTYQEVLLTNY